MAGKMPTPQFFKSKVKSFKFPSKKWRARCPVSSQKSKVLNSLVKNGGQDAHLTIFLGLFLAAMLADLFAVIKTKYQPKCQDT
jgi:hypothetical protein